MTMTMNFKKSMKNSVDFCNIENLYYIHIQYPRLNTSKTANLYLTGKSF